MPEGPEVRRLVDQIHSEVSGFKIVYAEILSGRYTKKLPTGWSTFSSGFKSGSSYNPYIIKNVKCKGKFIWFELKSADGTPHFMWNTLGMSGGWSYNSDETSHKHARVRLHLDSQKFLDYVDMRNFGTLHFYADLDGVVATQKKLKSIGRDFLQEEISDSSFKTNMLYHASHKTVPEALMNQAIFSGVGNYLKAESMYLAGISPHRKIKSLSDEEFSKLNRAIHLLIRESYKSGGSTLQTYKDLYGNSGDFSSRFAVYGQKKDPKGNIVEKVKTKDGRTTHWVPALQK